MIKQKNQKNKKTPKTNKPAGEQLELKTLSAYLDPS